MAIAQYLQTCGKNVPGIRRELYLTEASNVSSVTEAAGVITAVTITGGATGNFKKVQADLDSVQFTSAGTFKTSGGSEQSLNCRFSSPSVGLTTLVESLRDAVACGAVAIYVDNNAQAWLYGASGASKEGVLRPINEVETNLDTGTLITDEDTQAYTVMLKRLSAYEPIPFNGTVNGYIIGGSASAAFINWS